MFARRFLTCCLLIFSFFGPDTAGAQDEPGRQRSAPKLSTRFIPDDAVASVFVFPEELLETAEKNLMPTEIARAWSIENLGIDLADIDSIVLVVGVPGPGGVEYGLGVTLNEDFEVEDVNRRLLAGPAVMLEQYESYPLADTSGLFLHQIDARTAVVATEGQLPKMVAADEGTGPLPKLVATLPRYAPLMATAVVEPVRPQLNQAMDQISRQLPPPLAGAARVPDLLDAIMVTAGLQPESKFRLMMLGRDEASAAELEEVINNALRFGRDMAVAQSQQQMRGNDPVTEATRAYFQRLTGEIVSMLTPRRNGRRLLIEIENQGGIATTGVMVGLLLPAVQASREAARRMQSSNNLKQIMIAMHNYHDTYNHFPEPASRDDDGNPLLSWRVAILPFIEQQALYEEFRLDEPWNSEHNAKLIARMPAAYKDPSAVAPEGTTVYQAIVGEEVGLKPEGTTRLADITDGTSNTIMVVEADVATAVPWTKPSDVEIDLENPLRNMAKHRPGGFHVALMDGSIRFIANTVDLDVFRALLTRAGGEPVR